MKSMVFARDVIRHADEFCCLELEGERVVGKVEGALQCTVDNQFPELFTTFIHSRKGQTFAIGHFDSLNKALSYARQVRSEFGQDWIILDGYSWFHGDNRRTH